MGERFRTYSAFALVLSASILFASIYRHQTTFQEICNSVSTAVTQVCPSFLQVFVMTLLSPVYFVLSVIIAAVTVYLYKNHLS